MIGVNPKKSSGFFAVQKRLQLIEGSLAHMEWFGDDKSAFHVGEFTGLLVDYCRSHDIRFNIRGLRWPIKAFCTNFAMTTRTAHRLSELEYSTAAFTHGPHLSDRPREEIRRFLATHPTLD